MAHEIFQQSGSHMDYVDAFFAAYNYPNLAWIHQLGKSQFSTASATLLDLAQSDTRLGPTKFLLSMGKLCELVELEGAGDDDDSYVRDMDEDLRMYDELLDLVDVQQKLRKDLLETIADVNMSFAASVADLGAPNEEILTKATAITECVTKRLKQDGFTETITLFKRLVGNLIGDKRLGVEDTLDILGLKDSAQLGQTGFSVGLHLVSETRVSGCRLFFFFLCFFFWLDLLWLTGGDPRAHTVPARFAERNRDTLAMAKDLHLQQLEGPSGHPPVHGRPSRGPAPFDRALRRPPGALHGQPREHGGRARARQACPPAERGVGNRDGGRDDGPIRPKRILRRI